MSNLEDALAHMAERAGYATFHAEMWIDPSGKLWTAPYKTAAPDPDRPIPPTWVPIKVEPRESREL